MTDKAESPVASHRARRERQGFVRVEVNVRKEDASLVRRVASALSDPARRAEARALHRQRFVEPEIRKGPRCDVDVSAWYASITDADL